MAYKYQVWWLGGNLNKDDERRRYHQFGKTLAELFAGVATVNDHFRANYEFKWQERCTKEEFRKLWKKSSTAGILWHSHSDLSARPPAAMAYHHYIDGPADALPPADDTALYLIPRELGASTRNLRLLGLFYCHSDERYQEWKKVTPSETAIVAMSILMGDDWGDESNANFNRWSWDKCREVGDFAYRRSWKSYHEYEKELEKRKIHVGMRVSKNQAILNAWQFFKYLVYSGPAGRPPEKPQLKKWKFQSSLDVNTGPHTKRVPGPLGFAPREGQARPRTPLGLA